MRGPAVVLDAARRFEAARAAALAVALSGLAAAVPAAMPRAAAGEPDVSRCRGGMVVADEPLAAEVGLRILERGGNAVDAAVAVAFALAVTHPQAGNIGGGGFMLVRTAGGDAAFVDYREVAPRAAAPDMFSRSGGGAPSSVEGWASAGVPGTVAGLAFALARYGSLPWKELLEPAIRLARQGFPVSPRLSQDIQEHAARLGGSRASRRVLFRRGRPLRPGDTLRQKDLARTLETLARRGDRDFYEGSIARAIHRQMRRHGGLVTRADLAAYRVKAREPLRGAFRGHEILTAPPPSSGGVALLETLNVLDLALDPRAGPSDPATVHLVAEAMRRAFADRARYLADPDFACVPVGALTSRERAARLAASIARDRASSSAGLKMPEAVPEAARDPGCEADAPAPALEGASTTHFAVVDARGNAVANTYTLNETFGSGITVPGLGFLLNNEMDDFTTRPGAPNVHGLVQSEANRVEPGKRPLSSMAPTLVVRDGTTVLAVGGAGGGRIISAVTLVLLNRLAFGLPLAEAVALPRYHHQWLPDSLFVESEGFTRDQLDSLRALGHDPRDISELSAAGPRHIGQVNAIERDPGSLELTGVGDGRRGGAARGL